MAEDQVGLDVAIRADTGDERKIRTDLEQIADAFEGAEEAGKGLEQQAGKTARSLGEAAEKTDFMSRALEAAERETALLGRQQSALEQTVERVQREYEELASELDPVLAKAIKLTQAEKRLDAALDATIISQREHNRLLARARRLYESASDGASSFRRMFSEALGPLRRFADGIQSVVNRLTSLRGLVAAGTIALLLNQTVQAGVAFEGYAATAEAVERSQRGANRELAFAGNVARDLRLDLSGTTAQYGQFRAAARTAGLAHRDTREVFESVATAMRVLGKSSQDASGVFTALTQILSKGTVQAEELRGQLGERVSGAFRLAADAIGVTQAELNKLLEQGQVDALAFLPAFAKELKEEFGGGLKSALETTGASLQGLSNSVFQLKLLASEELNPAVRTLAEELEGLAQAEETRVFFQEVGSAAAGAVRGLTAASTALTLVDDALVLLAGGTLGFAVARLGTLAVQLAATTTATSALAAAQGALVASMGFLANPVVLLTAGVGALALAFHKSNQSQARFERTTERLGGFISDNDELLRELSTRFEEYGDSAVSTLDRVDQALEDASGGRQAIVAEITALTRQIQELENPSFFSQLLRGRGAFQTGRLNELLELRAELLEQGREMAQQEAELREERVQAEKAAEEQARRERELKDAREAAARAAELAAKRAADSALALARSLGGELASAAKKADSTLTSLADKALTQAERETRDWHQGLDLLQTKLVQTRGAIAEAEKRAATYNRELAQGAKSEKERVEVADKHRTTLEELARLQSEAAEAESTLLEAQERSTDVLRDIDERARERLETLTESTDLIKAEAEALLISEEAYKDFQRQQQLATEGQETFQAVLEETGSILLATAESVRRQEAVRLRFEAQDASEARSKAEELAREFREPFESMLQNLERSFADTFKRILQGDFDGNSLRNLAEGLADLFADSLSDGLARGLSRHLQSGSGPLASFFSGGAGVPTGASLATVSPQQSSLFGTGALLSPDFGQAAGAAVGESVLFGLESAGDEIGEGISSTIESGLKESPFGKQVGAFVGIAVGNVINESLGQTGEGAQLGAAILGTVGAIAGAYFGGPGGAAVGGAVGSAFGGFLGGLFDSAEIAFAGAIAGGDVVGSGRLGSTSEEAERAVREVAERFNQGVHDLFDAVGLDLASTDAAQIGFQLQDGRLSLLIDGVWRHYGENVELALNDALLHAIQNTDLGGIGATENVQTAIQNSVAGTLEGLVGDIDVAQELDAFSRGQAGQSLFNLTRKFDELGEAALRLELPVEGLVEEFAIQASRLQQTLQGFFDGVLGGDGRVNEFLEQRRQAELFNTELARQASLMEKAGESTATAIAKVKRSSTDLDISMEDLTEQTRDTSDILRQLADQDLPQAGGGLDGFIRGLLTGIETLNPELDILGDLVEELPAPIERMGEAARALSNDLEVGVLRELAAITGNQEAIARANRLEHQLRLAEISIRIQQLNLLGEISRRELAFLEHLLEQARELPAPSGGGTISGGFSAPSVGDGGFAQRERDRAALRAQFDRMGEIVTGEYSELGSRLAEENERFESELRRLSVFSDEYIARFLELNTQITQDNFLARDREIIAREGETDTETRRRQLNLLYDARLRDGEAIGLTAEQLETVIQARRIELAAIDEAEASLREDFRRELLALGGSVNPVVSQLQQLEERLLAANDNAERFGVTLEEVAEQGHHAATAIGTDFLQGLVGAGAELPGLSTHLIHLEADTRRTALAALALDDSFQQLLSTTGLTIEDIQAQIDLLEQTQIDSLNRPPPRPPRPSLSEPANANNSLEDLEQRVLQQIEAWESLALPQAERELAALNSRLEEMLDLAAQAELGADVIQRLMDAHALAVEDFWRRVTDPIRDFYDSLDLSQASPLGGQQQLGLAEGRFLELARRLEQNPEDLEALGQIQQAGRDLLGAAQNFNPDGPLYQRIFRLVQGTLGAVLGEGAFPSLASLAASLSPLGGNVLPFPGAVDFARPAPLSPFGGAGLPIEAPRLPSAAAPPPFVLPPPPAPSAPPRAPEGMRLSEEDRQLLRDIRNELRGHREDFALAADEEAERHEETAEARQLAAETAAALARRRGAA